MELKSNLFLYRCVQLFIEVRLLAALKDFLINFVETTQIHKSSLNITKKKLQKNSFFYNFFFISNYTDRENFDFYLEN